MNFKKAASIALAGAMAMSMMAVPAFADTESTTTTTAEATAATTYTITGPKDGHTYAVYQVFTGVYDSTSAKLTDVKYGSNAKGATAGSDVPDSVLTTITDATGSNKSVLAAVANYVDLTGTPVATLNDTTSTASVAAGYYYVVDTTKTSDTDTYSTDIVFVAGDVTITPKRNTPTVVKKVSETNDTTGTVSDWQDAADYDIGDEIPYELTATLPSNYTDYNVYKLVFTDTLTDALSAETDSVVITTTQLKPAEYAALEDSDKTNNPAYTDISSNFTTTYENNVLTLTASDLIMSDTAKNLTNSSKIYVYYKAKLTDKAVIGSAGNPNTVKLTYSNTPSSTQTGDTVPTNDTPTDKVTVFTFKFVANKVDGNNNALKGAGFTLYKEDASGNYNTVSTIAAGDNTTFTFSGLDSGTYKLSETTTPDGYSTADDVIFTITATYDTTSDDPQLTALTSDKDNVTLKSVATGEFDTTIVDRLKTSLPSTGGIGTRMFYVFGGCLVAAAVVLLALKKRREA
ncbi:MAG: isopeptide-forming domain-containing fimbrial protein [Chordicoccus sp.]